MVIFIIYIVIEVSLVVEAKIKFVAKDMDINFALVSN